MANESRNLGKALKKANANGGTLHDNLDPATVPEGAWKAGLPPAKYYMDPETDQAVAVPVVGMHQNGSSVPPALEQHVLEQYGKGVCIAELERKFELGAGYIRNALTRRFGSVEAMKAALKSLLLENGIATAQHTLANVESLHPSQSGMLSAAFTNAFLAMDKHERNAPKVVDFAALADFGETLQRIEKYAGIAVEVAPEQEDLSVDDIQLDIEDIESPSA